MKLKAIYVDDFLLFKTCTINFDSTTEYEIIPIKSAPTYYKIKSIQLSNEYDIFQHFNCRVTGFAGENGMGKTTITLLLKSIFSGKAIESSEKNVFVIYEIDGQTYFDKYQRSDNYLEFTKDKFSITLEDSELNDSILNITNPKPSEKQFKFNEVLKKNEIIFYSNVLSEIKEAIYESENIINLTLDYELRKFIKENRDDVKSDELYNHSNLVTDYMKKQSHNFMKMAFRLKKEFSDDMFFNTIFPFPDKIDYYAEIELQKDQMIALGINDKDFGENQPFLDLLNAKHINETNVNKSIEEQLKSVFIINKLIESRGKQKEEIKKFITQDSVFNVNNFKEIDTDSEEIFNKIENTIKDIEFEFNRELYTKISVVFDSNTTESLYFLIHEINSEYNLDFISFDFNRRFSSGQRNVLNIFTSIQEKLNEISKTQPIFVFDEIDQNLHPKWQREIIFKIVKYLSSRELNDFHLIFTSHSPFVIGDVPSNNLKVRHSNSFKSKAGDKTFAANIHDIYYENMGIESLYGEMTEEIVTDALKFLRGKESKYFNQKSDINQLIKTIGEPLLKAHISKMLDNYKENDTD